MASSEERAKCGDAIRENPRNYVAQPMVAVVAAIVGDHLEGRHVDLRPYILYGKDIYVLPGGLNLRAWRCTRARWWSTPRKAAAARTPGCLAAMSDGVLRSSKRWA